MRSDSHRQSADEGLSGGEENYVHQRLDGFLPHQDGQRSKRYQFGRVNNQIGSKIYDIPK